MKRKREKQIHRILKQVHERDELSDIKEYKKINPKDKDESLNKYSILMRENIKLGEIVTMLLGKMVDDDKAKMRSNL